MTLSFLAPFYRILGWLLAVFYSVIPDLGVAIILLTVAIMLLIYPLVVKQTKSMIAMQQINPELQKLRSKYKGPENRAKLNEETMRLFQERKINPMASCLPLIPQMFILIILNGVLTHPYKYVPESGRFAQLYEDFCPGYDTVKACEQAFKRGDAGDLGFISTDFLNLRLSALDNHGSLIHYVPYFALVVGVAVASYLMSSLSMKRNAAPNPQMAKVMKLMPIFFAVISLNFPSGLVLYFFVSSVWRVGQQEIIYRRHVHDPVLPTGGGKGGTPTRTATAVIDVEGRDAEVDSEPEPAPPPEPSPKPTPTKSRPPPRPSRPARPVEAPSAEGTHVADASTGGRGLRGLFRPPPAPPPGAPGSANPPKGPATRNAIDKGRSTSTTRPGQRPTGAGKKKKR